MSTEIAVRTQVVDPPNLAELAETINRELGQAEASANILVAHAIAAGKALLLARPQVRRGEWGQWLNANTSIGEKAARKYMRLADYEHIVGHTPDVSSGLALIAGQPARSQNPIWIPEAHAMRNSGATYDRIAESIGVSRTTVRYHLDPRAKRIQRQILAKRKARYRELGLFEDKRDAERAAAKGYKNRDSRGISACYSRLRRASESLDALGRNGATDEIRKRANAAYQLASRAEQEIVAILGSA